MSQIRDEFKVHLLNEEGIDNAKALAAHFSVFLSTIEELCGDAAPCEMAIVRTKLQEASFFAKRAMAMDPENQQSK